MNVVLLSDAHGDLSARSRARSLLHLLPLLLLIATAGCGGPGDAEEDASAGTWTPDTAWRLEGPVLDFGRFAGNPDYEFTSVRSALQLEDGRIVVASAFRPPEIRAYREDGSIDWIAGGEGQGPGEFTLVSWATRGDGDTLIAFDSQQGRSTLMLLGTGQVVGVVNLRQPVPGEVPERATILGRFADGTFLGFPNRFFPDGAQDYGTADVLLLRTQLDGTIVDTIGYLPWADMVPGEGGVRTLPLFAQNAVALPYGNRVLHGRAEDFTVQVYSSSGEVEGTLERPYERRPITDVVLAAAEEQELAQVRGPEAEAWRASIARRYHEGPRAEALPAYQRFLVDATDHIWVQHYLAPGDSVMQWSVFDPGHAFLGEVTVPSSLRLLDIGADRVVGLWRDEFDVQTLRVYELRKP